MAKRVLVLTAGVGSGHNVAASALEAVLEQHPGAAAVERIDVLEHTSDLFREIYSDTYFDLVKSVPWLVGWGYDYLDRPFRSRKALDIWEQIMMSRVVQMIHAFRPDAAICTHFMPANLLSLLIARENMRTSLSVVTTDYDFQAVWLCNPFDRFYVARDESKVYMASLGLPADRITVSGIPVKPDFSRPVDRAAVLTKHELRDGTPILLISAGAAGGDYALEIVAQTLDMQNPFQAIIVCGRNEELKAKVERMAAPRAADYRVLGYTHDMPALMQTADLFVGKPGGLTSSECMAVGLPMVLVNPIPGQEVRNSDFLLEEGAAVRCNFRTTVGYKIDELLGDPERRRRMAANAARIGRPHAAELIAETALREDGRHFWVSGGAQRALRDNAERGVIAVPGKPTAGQRLIEAEPVVPLFDAETGISIGVVTAKEFDSLLRAGAQIQGKTIAMNEQALKALRQKRVDSDLLAVFHEMLDDVTEFIVRWPERFGSPAQGGRSEP